eukprot:6302559-Amphidinium_carterae.1
MSTMWWFDRLSACVSDSPGTGPVLIKNDNEGGEQPAEQAGGDEQARQAPQEDPTLLVKFADVLSVLDKRTFLLCLLAETAPSAELAARFEKLVQSQPAKSWEAYKDDPNMPKDIVSNFSMLLPKSGWTVHEKKMTSAASLEELQDAKKQWKACWLESQVREAAVSGSYVWIFSLAFEVLESRMVSLTVSAFAKELKTFVVEVGKAAGDVEGARMNESKREDAAMKRDQKREEMLRKREEKVQARAKAALEKAGVSGASGAPSGKKEGAVRHAIFTAVGQISPIPMSASMADVGKRLSQQTPCIFNAGDLLKKELEKPLQEFQLELVKRRASGAGVSLRALKPIQHVEGSTLNLVQAMG